jgi:hypothetical protein
LLIRGRDKGGDWGFCGVLNENHIEIYASVLASVFMEWQHSSLVLAVLELMLVHIVPPYIRVFTSQVRVTARVSLRVLMLC